MLRRGLVFAGILLGESRPLQQVGLRLRAPPELSSLTVSHRVRHAQQVIVVQQPTKRLRSALLVPLKLQQAKQAV
jgi:hypothetical protein